MQIELTVVPDCPHGDAARALLRRVLDEIGLGSMTFEVVTLGDASTAEQLHFLGSRSFSVDGTGLFDEAGKPAGLTGRLYPRRPRAPEVGRPEARNH